MSSSQPDPGGRRTPLFASAGSLSSFSQSDTQRSPTRSTFIHSDSEHADDDDDAHAQAQARGMSPVPSRSYTEQSWVYDDEDSFRDSEEVDRALDDEFDSAEQALSGWSSAPPASAPLSFPRTELSVVPEQSEPSTRSSLLSSRPSSAAFLSGTWNEDILRRQRERLELGGASSPRPSSPSMRFGHSRGATDPGPGESSPRSLRTARRAGDLIAYFESSTGSNTTGSSSYGQPRSPSPSKFSAPSHSYTQSVSMPSLSRTFQEASSSMHTRSPTMPNLSTYSYSRPSSPSKTKLMSPSMGTTASMTMSSLLSSPSRQLSSPSRPLSALSLLSPPAPSTTLSSSVKSPPPRPVSPRSLPQTSVRNLVAAWTAATSSPSSSEGFFSIRRAAERRARQQGDEERDTGEGIHPSGRPAVMPPPLDASHVPASTGNRSSGSTGSSGNPGSFELPDLGEHFRIPEEPLRVGGLWYLNVHTAPPYQWQRCQAVLYPNKLLLTWIATGGGRGVVTLDLLNCTEVRSVPSPTHPSAQEDVGTLAAQAQAEVPNSEFAGLLEMLCPFQLLYTDGVERLAAESARERVRWVGALWNAIERAATVPTRASSPAPTIASFRSTASGSGSASTVFVPPMDTIPDLPDSSSTRSSSFASGSIMSYHASVTASSRASDDGAISNQGLVVPLGRSGSRVIAPSRSSSLRRTASLTDLDAEFASVARTLRSMGSRSSASRSSVAPSLLSVPSIPDIGSTRADSPAPSSRSYRSARLSEPPARLEGDDVFYSASSASSAAPSAAGSSSSGGKTSFYTPSSSPVKPLSITSPLSTGSDILRVLSPSSATQIVGSTLSYRRSDSASLLGDSHDESIRSPSETPSTPSSKLSRSPGMRRRTPRRSRNSSGAGPDSEKENDATESMITSPKSRSSGTPTHSDRTPRSSRTASSGSRSYSASYRSGSASGESASGRPQSSTGYDLCATSDWTEDSSCSSVASGTRTPSVVETVGVYTESAASEHPPSTEYSTPSEPPPSTAYSTPSEGPLSSVYRTPSTHSSLITERSHGTTFETARTPSESGSFRTIPSWHSSRTPTPTPSTEFSTAPLCPSEPSTAYATPSDGMASYLTPSAGTPTPSSPRTLPSLPTSRSPTLPPLPSSRASSVRPPSTYPSIPSYPSSSSHRSISVHSYAESPARQSTSPPPSPPQPVGSPVASLYSESDVSATDESSVSAPTPSTPSIMRSPPSPMGPRSMTVSSASIHTPSSPSSLTPSSPSSSSSSTVSSTSVPTPTPSTVSRTISSIRASTTPTPSSPHLSVPTTSLLSARSSPSPSSVSSLSVSTITASPIAPALPSPTAPSFRESLWAGESNLSYDSSALMPSPSMGSMSLAVDDEASFDSSVLRPTDSYASDYIRVPQRSLYRAESARSYASSILRPSAESIMGDEYADPTPGASTVPLPSSPTPTISASLTMSTPESNQPSIASQLETIPSLPEVVEEPLPPPPAPIQEHLVTEEVDRLVDYLRGLEEARASAARDLHDQLGRVEGSLFDLNNFVRGEERPPPVPRKDRSVGRSSAPPSERAPSLVVPSPERPASEHAPPSTRASLEIEPPPTPPMRIPTPSSIEDSFSYLSSPSSDSLLDVPREVTPEPPSPTSSSSSSPSSSSSDGTRTERPTSRHPSPRPSPLPIGELRDLIDGVRQQTDNLLQAQRETNDMLNELRQRPVPQPVDPDLAQRKMDSLQAIQDMVQYILETLVDREHSDLLDRLRNLLRGAGPREPSIIAPTPRSYAPSTILSDYASMQHPPPPPPTDIGPPEPTPMIVRPPPRPARARSISPVLPPPPDRSRTAPPLGGPYPPLRPLRRRPARTEDIPGDPGDERVPEESEDGQYDNIPRERFPRRGRAVEGEAPADEGSDLDFERFVRDRRARDRPGDGFWEPPVSGDGPRPPRPDVRPRPPTAPPGVSDERAPLPAEWRPGYRPGDGGYPPQGGMPPVGPGMPPMMPMAPMLPPPPAVIVPSVTIPDDLRRQLAEQHEHSQAAADQLVQLTEFTDSLSRWLERERHDRQNEFRGLNDRVDDLRHQIGELSRGGGFDGPRFMPGGHPQPVPDPPVIPGSQFDGGRLPPLHPGGIIPVLGQPPMHGQPFIPPMAPEVGGPIFVPGGGMPGQPFGQPPFGPMGPMGPGFPSGHPRSAVPHDFQDSPQDHHRHHESSPEIHIPPVPSPSPPQHRPGSHPVHTEGEMPHMHSHAPSRPHTPAGIVPVPMGIPPGPILAAPPTQAAPGVTVIQPAPVPVGPPFMGPVGMVPSHVPEAIPLPPSRFSHRSHRSSPRSVHVDVHPGQAVPSMVPQVVGQPAQSHMLVPVGQPMGQPLGPQEILVQERPVSPSHHGGRVHDYPDDEHRTGPSRRGRRHHRGYSDDDDDDDDYPGRRGHRRDEYDDRRRRRRRSPYSDEGSRHRRRRPDSRDSYSREREGRRSRRDDDHGRRSRRDDDDGRRSRRDDDRRRSSSRERPHRPPTTQADPHDFDPRQAYAQPSVPGHVATGTAPPHTAYAPTAPPHTTYAPTAPPTMYAPDPHAPHSPTIIGLPLPPTQGGPMTVAAPSPRRPTQVDTLNEAARDQALRDQEQRLADERQRLAEHQQQLADQAEQLTQAHQSAGGLMEAHQAALDEARGAQDTLTHRFGDAELGREDTFARHEADRQRLFEESEDRRRAEAEARRQAIFNVPPTIPPSSPPHAPILPDQHVETAIPVAPSRRPTPPLMAPVVPEQPVPIPTVVDLSEHQRFLEDMAEQMKQQMAQQLEDMKSQHAAALASAEERENKLRELVEQSLGRREEEERARVAMLEEELRKAKEEQEQARLLREQQQQEQMEHQIASLSDQFTGVNSGLGDITNLLKARDEADAAHRETLEARYRDKDPRHTMKDEKQKEILDLLSKLVHCCDEFKERSNEDRSSATNRHEDLLTQLRGQGTDFNDQLRSLGDGLREDNARRHDEVLATVRDSANSIALPNIEDYLNKFSRALAEEVRILLHEVGNLRHERRSLQYELGEYLMLKSKVDAGGQFDNTWVPVLRHWQPVPPWMPGGGGDGGGPPPPGAPGMPMPEPAPEEIPVRPAWRTMRPSTRGAKLRKGGKENAPPAAPTAAPTPAPMADSSSWTTWNPNPRWMPSPMPSTMPPIPEVVAPGLFGPRDIPTPGRR